MPTLNVVLCIGKRQGLEALAACIQAENVRVLQVFALKEDPHEITDENQAIVKTCEENGIPVRAGRVRSGDLEGQEIDAILAIRWRTMFPPEVMAAPKLGVFVIHDSLLPRYRGFAPLNWAMINGEKEIGATLFKAVDAVDAGPVLSQREFAVGEDEAYPQVYEKMVRTYALLVQDFLDQCGSGQLTLVPQDESLATFTCRRTPDDGRIEWNESAERIHDLVRALTSPCPGAFTSHRGHRLTVLESRVVATEDRYVGRIAGRIIAVHRDTGQVDVLCGRGILGLLRIEWEGRETRPSDVLKSLSIRLGREQD